MGAQQIVGPAFVSLLCICIAFVPMFFLPGVPGFLFVPLALAVVFAMIASFVLVLHPRPHDGHVPAAGRMRRARRTRRARPSPETRSSASSGDSSRRFERLRTGYGALLERALASPRPFVLGFLVVTGLTFLLLPFLGRDFFPAVDSGAIAPPRACAHRLAPGGDRGPVRPHRPAASARSSPRRTSCRWPTTSACPSAPSTPTYNNSGTIGPQDGDMLIQLARDHAPSADYVRALREELPRAFPGVQFAFLPAEITSQILNFGVPAPIDVQVLGRDPRPTRPSRGADPAPDVHHRGRGRRTHPAVDTLPAAARRTWIGAGLTQLGLTQPRRDRRASLLARGHGQVAPELLGRTRERRVTTRWWRDAEHRMESLARSVEPAADGRGRDSRPAARRTSAQHRSAAPRRGGRQPLQRRSRSIDVYANVQGRDLGGVAGEIDGVLDELSAGQLPPGNTITHARPGREHAVGVPAARASASCSPRCWSTC